jgi:pimeloyl-ACP methyl ester carboxylesterase
MRRTAGVLAATAGLVLAAAVAPAWAAPVRAAPCNTSFDIPGAACRTVTVPLDRSGAVQGDVHLFVERLNASKTKSKSTIVLFPGGPGGATSIYGRELVAEYGKALDDHDLLLVDQRGTGRSDYLNCDRDLTPSYPVPAGQDARQFSKTVERCAKKLGPKRWYYTTRETVADLEDVRQALGIDKFVLVGVSYGTVDAMAYANAHPDHVDRIVLDSLVSGDGLDAFGLKLVHALPRFLGQVCRGGGCSGFTTDPVADLQTLVARLQQGPLRAKRPVRAAGCAARLAITRGRLFGLIQSADEDPELASQLPVAIAEAARGRPYQLAELLASKGGSYHLMSCFAKRLFSSLIGKPHGMREDQQLILRSFSGAVEVATVCEESSLPWPRDAAIWDRGRLAEQALAPFPDSAFAPLDRATVLAGSLVGMCKFWTAGPDPAPAMPTTLPDVPTLILAGLDDLRTPAEDAMALAAALPHAHLLLVPDVGHSVMTSSHCSLRAFAHFMVDEPISDCHRADTHKPVPAAHVKSFEQQINELLKILTAPHARPAPAR